MTHCPRCGKTLHPDSIHTCSPKALVLADALEKSVLQVRPDDDVDHYAEFQKANAAAELRRLSAENEALKAAQYECGFGAGCCYQAAKSEADEALLRQALEVMKAAKQHHGVLLMSDPPKDAWKANSVDDKLSAAITAIRARLGAT